MENKTAENLNTLGAFCGVRDIRELSKEALFEKYGIHQADVLVLFGGSILAGGDLFAQAIKEGVAKKYIIVGGAGHTTETLRQRVHQEYPEIETADRTEAEVFQNYLRDRYDCEADELEMKSTNCGNNITYLLKLLQEKQIHRESVILMQDATMQRRMDAVLRKYVEDDTAIINYASYQAKVCEKKEALAYEQEIHGMWTVERYANLLMGEIPRLTDDKDGYGPNGKNFLAHVDVPAEVRQAFEELKMVYGVETRAANPLHASVNE